MGNLDKEEHWKHKKKAFFKHELDKQIEKELEEERLEALGLVDPPEDVVEDEPRDRFLEDEK